MSKRKAHWDNVDWAKQDIALAEELGVSRERVRQKRNALGKLKPESHRKHRISVSVQYAGSPIVKEAEFISKKYGISLFKILKLKFDKLTARSIWNFRRREFTENLRKQMFSHPFKFINWDLPSCVLSKIWGIPNLNNTRCQNEIGRAMWDGRSPYNGPELEIESKKEKQKCDEFWRTLNKFAGKSLKRNWKKITER